MGQKKSNSTANSQNVTSSGSLPRADRSYIVSLSNVTSPGQSRKQSIANSRVLADRMASMNKDKEEKLGQRESQKSVPVNEEAYVFRVFMWLRLVNSMTDM